MIPQCGIDDHPERRFPSAAQWRWVTAQHPTCRFPGCNRRAIGCECDHIVPFNGRNTVIANLEPVCRAITTANTTPAGRLPRLERHDLVDLSHRAALQQTDRRVACRRSVAGPPEAFVAKNRVTRSTLVDQD